MTAVLIMCVKCKLLYGDDCFCLFQIQFFITTEIGGNEMLPHFIRVFPNLLL